MAGVMEYAATEAGRLERDAVLRCARFCESLVVGGRAWTAEQAAAADVLFAAAKAMREAVTDGCQCDPAVQFIGHSEGCFWRPLDREERNG